MVKAVPRPEIDPISNGGIGGRRGGKQPRRSGTYFEKEAERYFDKEEIGYARRIIGSGSFGKAAKDPRLLGDLHIFYKILNKPILGECKFGYGSGGEKQITIKKEWFDKVMGEAELAGKYPALIFKFKGCKGPTSRVIAFTWETWNEIIEELTRKLEKSFELKGEDE